MHRRSTHWFSRVAVRTFFLVNRETLLDQFHNCQFTPSTRQDSKLASFLKEKETDILDIFKRLCPDHNTLPDLGKLVAAFVSTRASPETSAMRTPGTGPYTKALCHEFHKFFVSSLIACGNSLRILSKVHSELKALEKTNTSPKAQSAINRLKEKLPDLFEQVSKCVCLVWRITNSRILCHHFRLLQICHCLPIPSKAEAMSESRVFGRLTKELKLEAVGEFEDGRAEEVEPEEVEAEEDQAEDFKSIVDILHLDKSFMRWMQLLVAYSAGQDILTSRSVLSASILQNLNISIVAVHPSGVDRQMEPWDELLRSQYLHFPQDFNVEIAISAIKEEVSSRIGESCHTIFQKFQLRAFQLEFPGNLHCEMIVALLVQLAQDPVTSHTLGRLAQVWLPLHSNNIHQLNGHCRIWTIPSFWCQSLVVPCAGTCCSS